MISNNNRKIKIVFEFAFIQRNDEGLVETITFQDGNNTEITLLFNPKNDYTQNIEVHLPESVYKTFRGRVITEQQVDRIVSLADGKDIITSGLKDSRGEEEIITILFRRGKVIPYEGTLGNYNLHKFFDAAQNYIYISENDFLEIFGTTDVKDFITLGLTYSSIQRALEVERSKFPDARTAKIPTREIRRGEVLDESELDFNILNEVFRGQRRKDPRYNGEFLEVYQRIVEYRESALKEEAERASSVSEDYGFVEPKKPEVVNNVPVEEINEETSGNVTGWKRGAALREAQRRQVREDLENALRRIQELENILREKDHQIRERDEVIRRLAQEYKETKIKYEGLRKIVDGEDDNFTAVIYPTS